ncbi:MAG: hypothetical protein NVS3B12_27670 [Acidimicrobiales bacterium]
MATDNPVPLVSPSQLQEGAFADLTRAFSNQALNDICIEASRACETETDRRLMPFTITETHRAEGIDPDEYASVNGGVPMDILGVLGSSYASALGATGDWVRHFWLNEHGARYPEYWTYSNVSITLFRSIGGSQPANILLGPQVDTGEVWFRLGTFLPIGSRITCTYSGGYTTVPADLVRAAKYMAAALCARELDPMQSQHGHSPDGLEELAASWLSVYARSS